MKKLFTTPISFVAVTILMGSFALAQTPDGETPANEGVCDELMGLTPGLYGLCVAFCEAQDPADILTPITEEELEALVDASPSGLILANYNKKKKEGDPDMSCIKVYESCPCWTNDELASIDGILPISSPGFLQCRDGVITPAFSHEILIEGGGGDLLIERQFARTTCVTDSGAQVNCASSDDNPPGVLQRACQYFTQQGVPNISRFLTVPSTLTFEQYQSCQANVLEAINSRCTTPFPD